MTDEEKKLFVCFVSEQTIDPNSFRVFYARPLESIQFHCTLFCSDECLWETFGHAAFLITRYALELGYPEHRFFSGGIIHRIESRSHGRRAKFAIEHFDGSNVYAVSIQWRGRDEDFTYVPDHPFPPDLFKEKGALLAKKIMHSLPDTDDAKRNILVRRNEFRILSLAECV